VGSDTNVEKRLSHINIDFGVFFSYCQAVLLQAMKLLHNYFPGPSQLYHTVADHVRQAFREGIPSLSHRSTAFEKIFATATENLRSIFNLPSSFSIVFCSSATEIWERIIQNLVDEHSVHLVNGAFGKRFYEIARQLHRQSVAITKEDGDGFGEAPDLPPTELIGITHNETSTGCSFPLSVLKTIRHQHPESLIAVDAVSSVPYPEFDFNDVDTLYFSVQKGFGLPPGLGVWIVNERCLEKEADLRSRGRSTGSYHSLESLVHHARKNQTPSTPNVLGIYLLARVTEDFLRRGLTNIRSETEYKAAVLYHTLNSHSSLRPFVRNSALQSKTVIVAETASFTPHLRQYLEDRGILPGGGYGLLRSHTLRFANFPAHSKEQVEQLADVLTQYHPPGV